MGVYYQYAIVYGRILVWWNDADGREHTQWLEGATRQMVKKVANGADNTVQTAISLALS